MARRLISELDAELERRGAKIKELEGELESRDAERAANRLAANRWPFLPDGYPAQPTPDQLVEIRRAAMARGHTLNPQYYPRGADERDRQSVRAFESAFAAIETLRRSETIDLRHGTQMIADAVADRAKAMCLPCYGDIGISIVQFAIIAANDVLFLALDRAPHDLAFGLKIGDGPGRRSDGSGWKRLLAGKFIAPIVPPPMPQGNRSPARVR
jgi:hypothetical protein